MRIVEKKKINEANKKGTDFFNNYIKKALENKLKKLTKITFNVTVYEATSDYISIQDKKNVVSEIGAFGAALKEIYISGGFWFDKKTSEANGSIDFRYKSKSEGTNGLTLINFYYEDEKLIFKDASGKII